ncbi:hypothetical protein BGY98DRAFT_1099161 [Russula aff. rugulosa BPL654]|nr:hypothetical protein BGY98DRAFT_1099161 [Russula aff. rugulosa BPL654]
MESTDQKHQGTCEDTEQSPNSAINRFPDVVLLEIFDFYRQSIDDYDNCWRKNYAWFNLAHACKRWRAVMFASSFRLDINVIVGPVKPDQIKTILSGRLPILIDYSQLYGPSGTNRTAVWRMRAALGRRDRVRGISFGGYGVMFKKFIKATNYHFPALESLALCFPPGHKLPEIPATFLRGPDQSDLPLRRLRLDGGSMAFFVSGLLPSAKALTDLTLDVTAYDPAAFDASQGSHFLVCLQGMQSLRNLDLTIRRGHRDFLSQASQHSPVPKHPATVPAFSPVPQDVSLEIRTKFPLPYLSRVIDDVREEFWSVSVAFDASTFHLLSSTHLGEIDHFKPSESSFMFNVNCFPDSINSTSTPSTKLAVAEELTLNFPSSEMRRWVDVFSLREFLRQFRSVRVLRVNPFVREVGLYLKNDDDEEAILPVLEEVEISISRLRGCSDEEYQRRAVEVLAAFEPCERAGRFVKVSHCKQTQAQLRNARS